MNEKSFDVNIGLYKVKNGYKIRYRKLNLSSFLSCYQLLIEKMYPNLLVIGLICKMFSFFNELTTLICFERL